MVLVLDGGSRYPGNQSRCTQTYLDSRVIKEKEIINEYVVFGLVFPLCKPSEDWILGCIVVSFLKKRFERLCKFSLQVSVIQFHEHI